MSAIPVSNRVFRRVSARWQLAEPLSARPRAERPRILLRVRAAGFGVLALQFLFLCWWNIRLVDHYALTHDFTVFGQAAYLIAHGHLDPFVSTIGHSFWRDHGSFIFWPIALLYRIYPHLVVLQWVQDAASVGAEAVAFAWLCDVLADKHNDSLTPRLVGGLAMLGLLLLVANPWTEWGASFDFHVEALSSLFVMLTARDLFRGRSRAWIWFALGLLTGDVASTYLGALGLSAVLAGRRWWRSGMAMLVIGFGWLIFLGALGATKGSSLAQQYNLLLLSSGGLPLHQASVSALVKTVLTHPAHALSLLWASRVNLWGVVSPGGLLGLFWLPLLVPAVLVLVEGGLSGPLFSRPGFQNIILVPLIVVGTVAICAGLANRAGKRRRWLVAALGAVIAANAVVWAGLWLPQLSTTWLRVSPGAAAVLNRLHHAMSPADEVITEQGISGGFSDRADLYELGDKPARLPVRARKVWVIFAPGQGVEPPSTAAVYADIGALAARPGMRLVASSDGIWAFEWRPPNGIKQLSVPGETDPVPAWMLAGASGRAIRRGGPSAWHATSTTKPGYVIDQEYWRGTAGVYRATVTLSATGRANVELWNATTSKLLRRLKVDDTHGKRTVSMTAILRMLPIQHGFSGWRLWSAQSTSPIGDGFEIRVWSPGATDHVSVYDVNLEKLSSPS
jgi:Predicted membrane protein (DUF2079)